MSSGISYFDIGMESFGVNIAKIEKTAANTGGYDAINAGSVKCDAMIIFKVPFDFMDSRRQGCSGIICSLITDIVETIGLVS